jgi:excisionase family DNA binding protein
VATRPAHLTATAVVTRDEQLISSQEMCNLLNVTNKTLLRYVREGRVPAPIRPGGRQMRWPWGVVRRYIGDLQGAAGSDRGGVS